MWDVNVAGSQNVFRCAAGAGSVAFGVRDHDPPLQSVH